MKPQLSSTLWWNIFLPPSNDCRSASRRTQCVRNSPSCASLAGLRRVPSQQTSSHISLSHLNSLWSTAFYYEGEGLSFRHHYEKSCWTGGHQGITKCRELARQSVWWPGLAKRLEELVHNCQECLKAQRQHPQPLTPTPLPQLPWQKVASDLFEWKQTVYLLMVDYYSRYIEIARLSRTTTAEVVSHLKSIFARHGIPEIFISDNGPQYASREFEEFAKFRYVTSSPYFLQANGEAERAVGTIKGLLKKGGDPYKALLAYHCSK